MTVFFEVLDTSPDEKGAHLRAVVRAAAGTDIDSQAFRDVPGSPFAYWLSPSLRKAYSQFRPFQSDGRAAVQGLATTDDFRFIRAWWEVSREQLGRGGWAQFARSGGATARYFGSSPVVINWTGEGAALRALITQRYGNAGKRIYNEGRYFSAGFCWPLRGTRLAVKAVGPDSVFGIASKMAFVEGNQRSAFLALLNSAVFDGLLRVQAGSVGGVQYEAGLIARTPVPSMDETDVVRLGNLGRRAWSLKRSLDTTNELSHAFILPGGLNEKVTGFNREAVERDLAFVEKEIDDTTMLLYAVSHVDLAAMQAWAKRIAISDEAAEGHGEDDQCDDSTQQSDDDEPASPAGDATTSWLVGVAFGRFDPRLVTGDRAVPSEPDPFDPLPSRSAGMWPEGEEPEHRPDVLVDDEGHPKDLVAVVRAIAEGVHLDVSERLRAWLAKEFFPLHIKIYSKNRRKAPIYWQLATPSAIYSVWLYIHAFSKDTLFRVQNDYAAPKLAHEERRLESLSIELRDKSTATQRKKLAAQESIVEELRGFLEEVKRIAALWNPNLDDGVVINFAPLWRLVPQHKAWQKELKATWDALCNGQYDWAHLAMHLWPERVVPKCRKDRSLAIAHGLEDVFWVESDEGKWSVRKMPAHSVDELVRQRTSPAVKSALKSVLEAPTLSRSGGAGRTTRRRSGHALKAAD